MPKTTKTTTTAKSSQSTEQVSPIEAAAAFASIEEELATVTPEEIPRITIDIGCAVSVALGALPHLRALRPAIEKDMPKHPIALLDKLETYALGAWYAHLLAGPQASGETPVKKLLEEATPLRETLLVAAEALAHRKLVDAPRVAAIRSGKGHIDLAGDLVALAALYLERWSWISEKTAVELHEVQRAAALGPQLLVALGERGQPLDPRVEGNAERRLRAFALFLRAYDACRRAVEYLRWDEGDADTIAPSLFKGRGGGRRPSEVEAEAIAEADTELVNVEDDAPAPPK